MNLNQAISLIDEKRRASRWSKAINRWLNRVLP